MHILLCSSYPYLPELRGGLQTSTDELCRVLGEKGISTTVLSGLVSADPSVAPRRDMSLGYPVIRAADPAAALPLVAAAAGPTLIMVQSGQRLAVMLEAALATGLPVAVYLHNVEQRAIDGILPPDPRILYFANSRFAADRWHALFGIDCAVLPPTILPGLYLASCSGNRVLFVNPVPEKGIERVAQLAAANTDIPFLITESWAVGEDWRAWMRQRFGALRNIEWRPATTDMRELFAESRLLLMPSVWEEAYGRTVIEAQLNGLPVLASNRGALAETVGKGGAVLDLQAPDAAWNAALRSLYFDEAARKTASEAAKINARAHVFAANRAVDDALVRLNMHSMAAASH